MAIDTRFMAEYLRNPALQAKYGNFSEFQDFMLSQQPTSFQQPNMFDVAGPINENLRDLGNPLNDPRVVSEEMGLVGTNTTMPTMADVAGDVNENLIDRGNPLNDPRVVSEEMGLVGGIPDRNRGVPGMSAFEMIGGQAVPVGDVLGKQMALEKADFVEETPKGLAGLMQNFNPLAFAAGLINPALGLAVNIGSRARSGLGSLGTKLGDFREKTTGYRTQAEYDRARADRQAQNRTDRMIDRIAAGKKTRSNPRDAGTTQAQKDAISEALQDARRGGQYSNDGGGGGGGKSIVCTAMYQTTGLQDWKKAMKIWYIYQKKHLTDTHQEGYHWLFKPFVKAMKKSKIVEALGAHVAKHRTQELKHILFNSKSDKLGKVYNMILEPICFIAGKIKSALGRG